MQLFGRKKAIIFDMDGVLVDSEKYYIKLITEMLALKGIMVDKRKLYPIIGADKQQCLKYICSLVNKYGKEEGLEQEILAYLNNNRPNYKTLLFDEVVNVLGNLAKRGYILALASSSSLKTIDKMLNETGLGKYFEIVVGGDQLSKSKPDPMIYNYTINRLGLKKEECIIVEDSKYGVEAGKCAGVNVIAVNREELCQQQNSADMIIDTLQKLETVLK